MHSLLSVGAPYSLYDLYFYFLLFIFYKPLQDIFLDSLSRRGNFPSDQRKLDVVRLSNISRRIKSFPVFYLWLPKSVQGLNNTGKAMLLLCLIPVVALFMNAHWLKQTKIDPSLQNEEMTFEKKHISTPLAFKTETDLQRDSYEYYGIISRTVLPFWIGVVVCKSFEIVFRSALALLRLDHECKKSNWDTTIWLKYTTNIPSGFSFATKGVSYKRAKTLHLFSLLTFIFPIVVVVVGIILITMALIGGISYLPMTFFALIVIYFGAIILTNYVRRRVMKWTLDGEQLENIQSPVVYLRAFNDDENLASFDGLVTVEEEVVMYLRSSGRRVVGLGKPGESLPPIGAERFYVDDCDWQQVVNGWIRDSFSAVMIASTTDATGWEIEEVFKTNSQRRFLLLFLNAAHFRRKKKMFGLTIDLPSPDNPIITRLIFERLKALGVPNLDWDRDWQQIEMPTIMQNYDAQNFRWKQVLLAIGFNQDGSPILFTSDKRDKYSFEEIIKRHFANLETSSTS